MFKINSNLLFILAVLSIFILIPSSFAAELNDTQAIDDLSTPDEILTADEDIIYVSPTASEGDGSESSPYNLSTAVSVYDSDVNSKIIMKNGEYNFSEQLNLDKSINIEGESYDGVILNGAGETSILKASSGSVMLSNLKFVNGYSEYDFSDNRASGLEISSVNSILINYCIFENNSNGAISAHGPNAVIDIQNCYFNNNYMDGWAARGAAVNLGADNSQLTIVNTTFKDNAVESDGGAIYGRNNFKSLIIDNCKFINNIASGDGSAISAYSGGDISIFNTQFINQTSPVIYDEQRNANYLTLYVRNLTFDNQSAENIVVKDKVNLINLDDNDRISGNDISMSYGDDENYTVTLTDGDGNPISEKLIIVTLTDYYGQITTLNSTTNAAGQAIFSMKNQIPGRYKIVAYFAGDSVYNMVNTTNSINIKSENLFNILLIPNSIKVKEGESYIVQGIIADEYYEPTYYFDSVGVDVEFYNPNKMALSHAIEVDGCYFTFDIVRCALKTNDTPYIVTFILDPEAYEGEVSFIEGNLTVDLSRDLPDIGDSDVIYVSSYGNDTTGNGSEDNPLASVQLALIINSHLGGGKTIIVGEGTYNISNFNIGSDVTIIGNGLKTIFKQDSGNQGMFKMMSPVCVNFVNLTFTDGYTTPQPYSLITAFGEGVLVNIDGCEFKNNTCFNGGAIAISHGAYVYVSNSKFIGNRAILSQSTAGAICVLEGYLKVTNTEFINNTASSGGAIWIGYDGKADIIDSTFNENSAYNDTLIVVAGGGAIYTRGITTIKNSSFIKNHADLYGGAIYISGGETAVSQSYFENNSAGSAYDASIKGSTIEGESFKTYTLNVEYSIFLTNDRSNYIALFANNDEATINLEYNYWGSNTWNMMNTNINVLNYVILQPRIDTNPIYKDTNATINVEFKNYNAYDGIVDELRRPVHAFSVDVSSVLNNVNTTTLTIVNNLAKGAYYPVRDGLETITIRDTKLEFTVVNSTKKDVNANITINPADITTIIIKVPTDLSNNVSISVKNKVFSKSADDGTIIIVLDTLPGDYKVIVSYDEDENYKAFSTTETFNVAKYKSNLNVTANSVYKEQSVTVDVNITEGATGNVIIVLNGKYRYSAEISNGQAYKILYDLDVGNYTVDVIYEGDDYYEGCNGSATFNVVPRPPEPVEPVDGYAYISVQTGSITKITIRVPSDLTKNVTIMVNDDDYSRECGDGVITLNVSTETSGDYSVFVNYDGDEYYNEFSAFKTFKIYDYCWFIGETGYRTLREAVEAAGNGDVIKGNITVYEIDETINIGHREMPSEPWEIVKNVTITSMSDNPITIKGSKNRLFSIDKDSHLTISNLILTGSNVGPLDGGAIQNQYDASVTIINCTFTNFTADRGGALFLWGQALVKDSVFIDNFGNIGGAIFILSPVTNDNNVILDNITVINNSAESYGAGLYVSGSLNNYTIIKNSRFINNSGHGKGGALFVTYGNVIIDNVLFDSNEALNYDFENEVDIAGGAVYVSKYVNAEILNSKFINNYAEQFAGALGINNAKIGYQDLTTGDIVWYSYTTNIKNCTFTNNTAGIYSGAIYIGFDEVSTVNIENSTFDSNKAQNAIVSNNIGIVTIKDSKFTNNVATNGTLILTYGFYSEQDYNAETEIIDCTFENNDVLFDIFQYNSYTILLVEYSNFTDDAAILVNYGTATLNNVVQSGGNSNYSIANANKLSLSKNTFLDSIINDGRILTPTYIIVLDNETKSGEINSIYPLKAIVCDDNGNIIEVDNLTFVVDENELLAAYNNNEFSANYTLVSGSHLISAKCSDTGLSGLIVKTAVLIAKNPSNMAVVMDDIEFSENAVITVNVDSKASGNVTVKINDEIYESTVKNGEVKFNIPDLAIGEYSVEITYAGDDSYAPKSQLITLTVSKISKYSFDVNALNITTNSAVINIILPVDFNGEVIAVIDSNPQNVAIKNGKGTISLSDLTIGNHNVEVTFNGTDKYANSTSRITFKISKLDSYVLITVNDVVEGDNAIIKLVVPGDATGDVFVTVDGTDYLPTIFNGNAYLSIPDLEIGEHDVDATYIGDGKYFGSNNFTSFNVVDKKAIKKSFIELTIDGTIIKGILKDSNGNSIPNAVIVYSIDGVEAGNVSTNENGEFSVQGVEGKKFMFEFEGNVSSTGSLASVTLKEVSGNKIKTVIDAVSQVSHSAVDLNAGEKGGMFYVTLRDVNGNALADKEVQITFNGKTNNVITDGQGRAGFYVNIASAGTYYYVISFKGDSQYEASSIATVKLTVTKKKTSIVVKKATFKAKVKVKKITVTLKTIKNVFDKKTYLKTGMKLTLKVKGKIYTAKINKKGKAVFKVKKLTKKGKYTAVIKFKGDKTYKASSKKIKIIVK